MAMFGLYFYWLGWLLWIVVTFFFKKTKKQTLLSSLLLIIIIFANRSIPLQQYQISISFLLIFLSCIIFYNKINKSFYHLAVIFTLMVGYAGVLFWIDYTPIWLFMHELLLIPLFCNVLIILLVNRLYERIIALIFGMVAGELFYHLLLISYGFQQTIGNLNFLDQLFVTLVALLIFHGIQTGMRQLYTASNNYKQRKATHTVVYK